jgi:PAS domain S-box-containing protein
MSLNAATVEHMLDTAMTAVATQDAAMADALDRLPAAIYVTDSEGVITYYNKACVALAGRVPEIGRDRWCVTWKLFTSDGEFLPHDRCPMAVAIQEGRPVRDVEAIAERPDGSRINFRPYPTPLFDRDGNLAGAVNLLLDVSDEHQPAYLSAQAERCRRLAGSVNDSGVAETLSLMAAKYDEKALKASRHH